MKKSAVSCLILMVLLSGCGNDLTNRGPVPTRVDGGEVRSGEDGSADTGTSKDDTKADDTQSETGGQISDAYPEELPSTAVWTEYPGDNLFGLSAMTTNSSGDVTTTIFAFEYLKNSEVKDRIIRNPKYLDGYCPYGTFQFDDVDVIEQDDCYFVKLSYDSRIELTWITFSNGDERCIINMTDGIDLTYCDFSDIAHTKRIYQSFDPDTNVWEDKRMETSDETPKEDIGYVRYTELAIDQTGYDTVSAEDGILFMAMDYGYRQPSYNIYGEIESDPDTSLRFYLLNEDGMAEEQDHFTLYQKTGNSYVDITPSDCAISTETFNGDPRLWIDMHSSLLGELTEGDYRAEYGDYTTDFRLTMQDFEVW